MVPKLERILGVDPGIAATGWCLIDVTGHVVQHGVITRQKKGRATWRDVDDIIAVLTGVIQTFQPRYVVVEDYVWHGKRRGFKVMSNLVGAIFGVATTFAHAKITTPKKKGPKRKPRKAWTQHDTDALHIAKTLLPSG